MRISADVIIMVCHYYGGKDLIKRIEDVILTVDVVFDTYPQVVAKFISQFLKGRRRFEVEKRQVKNVDTNHEYRCIGKPMNKNHVGSLYKVIVKAHNYFIKVTFFYPPS
jgi:hypothetical protein